MSDTACVLQGLNLTPLSKSILGGYNGINVLNPAGMRDEGWRVKPTEVGSAANVPGWQGILMLALPCSTYQ